MSEEAWFGPPCARRTTTASPWGFREQWGPSQAPPLLPSPLKPLNDKNRKGGCDALTARMHRSPSEVRGARAQKHDGRPSLLLSLHPLLHKITRATVLLSLRASNEGLRRPRVARAKEHDRRPRLFESILTFRMLFSTAALSRLWPPSGPAHRYRRKTARR